MEKYGKSTFIVGVLACTVLIFASICAGQGTYPNKPITLIVPAEAGGSGDLTARAIAEDAGKLLGQPVMVVDRPGAGGTVGLTALHQAEPDGYTLGSVSTSHMVRASNMSKVIYDPIKDFRPIMSFGSFNAGLCVLPDSESNNLAQFLKYSRAHPGLSFSGAGPGNISSVTLAWLARKEKIDWREVPYKGGAPAITALLGKHVDFHAGAGAHVPFLRDKRLKMLVVFNPTRMAEFPEIPTLKDLGYDFQVSADIIVLAPARIPQPVFDKLQAVLLQVASGQSVRNLWKKLDIELKIKKGDEVKEDLILENKNMISLFKELGLLKK